MTALAHARPGGGARSTSPPGAEARPGFWQGVRAVPEGMRFLAARPACWPAASVPCLVLLLLSVPIAWWAIGVFGPWLGQWLLPETSTWYAEGARITVRWLGSALAAYLGLWLSLLLAFLVTTALGYATWHAFEKRALAVSRRLGPATP